MSNAEQVADLKARAELVARNLAIMRRLTDLHSTQVAVLGVVLNMIAENKQGIMESIELSMQRVEEAGASIASMVAQASAEVEEIDQKIEALRGSN